MVVTTFFLANGSLEAVKPSSKSVKWMLIDAYERKLRSVAFLAVVASALQKLSQFLGLCGLTWATVVVLGGYVTELSRDDYYLVTFLLVLESWRLCAAIFFGHLVTKKLVYLSPLPTELEYNDSKRQVVVAIIRMLDQMCQLILIAISIFLPLLRLRHLYRQGVVLSGLVSESFCGLGDSLFVFYSLVLGSAIVSGFAVLYSKSFVLLDVNTPSLQRYFDEIMCRGWSESLLAVNEFDFLAFTFKIQAEEYHRNVQPVVVCELYRDMLEYLYVHDKGAEAARIALEAGDSYEQQAAANVVGLWVAIEREGGGKKRLRLMKRLLAELAKAAAGEGKTGKAAVTSLEKLGEWDPEGVMQIRSKGGVVRILSRAINEQVEGQNMNGTLAYVKAMIPLLKKKQVVIESMGEEAWRKLREDLRSVWEGSRSIVRTKAAAGWALHKMNGPDEINEQSVRDNLLVNVLRDGEYLHQETELEYVNNLLNIGRIQGLPAHWKGRLDIKPTLPQQIPRPFLAKRRAMLLSGLLTLLLIASAIAFLLHRVEPFSPSRPVAPPT